MRPLNIVLANSHTFFALFGWFRAFEIKFESTDLQISSECYKMMWHDEKNKMNNFAKLQLIDKKSEIFPHECLEICCQDTFT